VNYMENQKHLNKNTRDPLKSLIKVTIDAFYECPMLQAFQSFLRKQESRSDCFLDSRFHGNDERLDKKSLNLTRQRRWS
jgi:hypothetical protein